MTKTPVSSGGLYSNELSVVGFAGFGKGALAIPKAFGTLTPEGFPETTNKFRMTEHWELEDNMETIVEEHIPKHIALIMDGNGRWARRQGMPRLQGHFHGYKTLKNIVIAAADLGVEALTAYAFSSENWTRDTEEVSGIFELVHYALQAELEMMKEEGVRIIVSGRTDEIPAQVIEQFNEDIEATKGNSRVTLNIALNYGGRNEIVDAARRAAEMVVQGKIGVDEIDDKLLSSLMYHPELPDPDLLIRTAGELRISNFLIWETAYTEMYVTDLCWPEFSKEELVKAIESYQKRTRKFGSVVEES